MFSSNSSGETGSPLDGLPALFAAGSLNTKTSNALSSEMTWVVPAGVTSISAVCVGAGASGGNGLDDPKIGPLGNNGGGGGALTYATIAVTPGESLTIGVGLGGLSSISFGIGGYGGDSYIKRSATDLLRAGGGGVSAGNPMNGGSKGSYSGGNGGDGGNGQYGSGGGGGAGGYSAAGGKGGDGGNTGLINPQNGSSGNGGGGGGGGGGDLGTLNVSAGGGGGGVALFGSGTSGAGGAKGNTSTNVVAQGGGGGSGGTAGSNGITTYQGGDGGGYGGGGGGGVSNTQRGGYGAPGCVRIVLGSNKFPSSAPENTNEAVITNTATTTWTVPTGVTSVSVVCVGGGGGGYRNDTTATGGGGGGLRYYNNLSVTPGSTVNLAIGVGGSGVVTPTNGGDTWFNGTSTGTASVWAGGGVRGLSGGNGGTGSTTGGSIGGGNGGNGGGGNGVQSGGGAGAGGYTGNGGNVALILPPHQRLLAVVEVEEVAKIQLQVAVVAVLDFIQAVAV